MQNLFARFQAGFPADRARPMLTTPAGARLSYADAEHDSARFAALLTAGLSLIVLTVFDSVVARNLPFVFIVILFTGLFASQLQERMRTLSGSSGAP